MSYKFFGGVHPNDKKSPSNTSAARPIAPPPEVVIPMSLHIGAPCSPIVEVGADVKLGQKIGDTEAPVAAPIHASVSGTVKAVEPRLHSNGTMVMSVVIENDGQDRPDDSVKPHTAEEMADPDALVRIIREAGIVGMGGATFPTAFKISSGMGQVKEIIINGAECEPYITSDHRTMLEHPEEVLEGIRLLMVASKVTKATLAIESNKQDAIDALKRVNKAGSGIEILALPTLYPQGAEKQLVQTVTGREIPPGGLPAAVGCAVYNVFTAYCVYRACYEGMPAVERLVTVSGSGVADPCNVLVRVGTSVDFVFEQIGGISDATFKVIMGGPMMGAALYDLSVGATKGTNALLAFAADEDQTVEDPACIRCGKCSEACPMKLMPAFMYMYERKNDLAAMEKFNLMDCIECGACTYGCPAKLHLTHSFRTGKARLQAKAAADRARAEAEAKAAEEAKATAAAGKGA